PLAHAGSAAVSVAELEEIQLRSIATAERYEVTHGLAVTTPHGLATQLMLPDFEALQKSINAGTTPIYRAGRFERPLISGNQIDLRKWSYAAEGQFGGVTNPATDMNYARGVGAASVQGSEFDWIIKARRDPQVINLNAPGITRQAPALF